MVKTFQVYRCCYDGFSSGTSLEYWRFSTCGATEEVIRSVGSRKLGDGIVEEGHVEKCFGRGVVFQDGNVDGGDDGDGRFGGGVDDDVLGFLYKWVQKIRKKVGVSKNSGTPKSSILIGFSIINHPFWGTPIFGNTQVWKNHNLGNCVVSFLLVPIKLQI